MSKKKKLVEPEEEDKPTSSLRSPSPEPPPLNEAQASADDSDDTSSSSDEDAPPPNPPNAGPCPPTSSQDVGSSAENKLAVLPRNVLVFALPASSNKGSEGAMSKSSKRVRGEGEEEGKQSLFQRLYSEDDELAILRGVIEYRKNRGADPKANPKDFHEFIMGNLTVEVDANQLLNKIRSLRVKYLKSLAREDKSRLNANEAEVLELSKQVWDISEEEISKKKRNKRKRRMEDEDVVVKDGAEADCCGDAQEKMIDDAQEKMIDDAQEKMIDDGLSSFKQMCVMMGMDEDIMRDGLALVKTSDKKVIAMKWRELQLKVNELKLQKLSLFVESANLIFETLKSST